ncbi:MAG: hypothetical protein AAF495_08015, partial [Pseudomonadota bacterium]
PNTDCIEDPQFPDVHEIWQFDLPTAQPVKITGLIPNAPLDTIFMQVYRNDGVAMPQKLAVQAFEANVEIAKYAMLPAGTYYIWVSSDVRTGVGYELSVECGTEEARCLAGRISCGQTVADSLDPETDCIEDPEYPDVHEIWQFDLPTAQPVEITGVIPNAPLDTIFMQVYRNDGVTVPQPLPAQTHAANKESAKYASLPAGTYYVWISSDVRTGVGYELSVTCGSAPTVEPRGFQRPGDANQDGRVDLSDGIAVLGFLFLGGNVELPCGDGSPTHAGNVALLDSNASGRLDLTDGIYIFNYLFLGGTPPALGLECVEIEGCPTACN